MINKPIIRWEYVDGVWKCYLSNREKIQKDNEWTHGMDCYDEFWYEGKILAVYYPFRNRENNHDDVYHYLLIDGSWQSDENLKETDIRVVIEKVSEFNPLTKAEELSWILLGKKN